MHIALYRKYRSSTFDDVVGQEHIITTLKNELQSGTPSHAYLFTGTRGTGKTSCAKIMAKALNCTQRIDANPCGVCEICRGIDDGSVMDVVEIDAASNNGVDNIRDLRDEANFTPSAGKYRVYIIDEVHMLSTGAFNALLKIMEEPPVHVIFILATTEVHKIPATILSRCQRFDFRRIGVPDIAKHLNFIAENEGMTLTQGAAELIAMLSEGAMRDAISLLDLCSSHSNDINEDIVAEASGIVGRQHLFAISAAIIAGDTKKTLEIVEELSQQSMETGRLCEQLMGHFRNLMLMRATAEAEDIIEATPADFVQLREQAKGTELEQIIFYLTVLEDTIGKMTRTAQGKTELEIALVTMCSPKLSADTSALILRIEKLENLLRNQQLTATTNTIQTVSKPIKQAENPVAEPTSRPVQSESEIPSEPHEERRESQSTSDEETLFGAWQEVLAKLEKVNGALYGALAQSNAYIRGSHMLIDCKDDFFLKLMRENEYAKESLKHCILEVTGSRYNIGPYTAKTGKLKKTKTDPLEDFIKGLDLSDGKITVE